MLPRHVPENKPRFSQAEAARRLGVTRWHLNRVLRGHRQSRSLTAKYWQLQQEPIAAEGVQSA
jgi:predicted XRE-type DNA-binding protein